MEQNQNQETKQFTNSVKSNFNLLTQSLKSPKAAIFSERNMEWRDAAILLGVAGATSGFITVVMMVLRLQPSAIIDIFILPPQMAITSVLMYGILLFLVWWVLSIWKNPISLKKLLGPWTMASALSLIYGTILTIIARLVLPSLSISALIIGSSGVFIFCWFLHQILTKQFAVVARKSYWIVGVICLLVIIPDLRVLYWKYQFSHIKELRLPRP